jgi:hypothetical protein
MASWDMAAPRSLVLIRKLSCLCNAHAHHFCFLAMHDPEKLAVNFDLMLIACCMFVQSRCTFADGKVGQTSKF